MDWTDHERGADRCGWGRVRDFQVSAPEFSECLDRVGFGDPAFPAILAVVFLLRYRHRR